MKKIFFLIILALTKASKSSKGDLLKNILFVLLGPKFLFVSYFYYFITIRDFIKSSLGGFGVFPNYQILYTKY